MKLSVCITHNPEISLLICTLEKLTQAIGDIRKGSQSIIVQVGDVALQKHPERNRVQQSQSLFSVSAGLYSLLNLHYVGSDDCTIPPLSQGSLKAQILSHPWHSPKFSGPRWENQEAKYMKTVRNSVEHLKKWMLPQDESNS